MCWLCREYRNLLQDGDALAPDFRVRFIIIWGPPRRSCSCLKKRRLLLSRLTGHRGSGESFSVSGGHAPAFEGAGISEFPYGACGVFMRLPGTGKKGGCPEGGLGWIPQTPVDGGGNQGGFFSGEEEACRELMRQEIGKLEGGVPRLCGAVRSIPRSSPFLVAVPSPAAVRGVVVWGSGHKRMAFLSVPCSGCCQMATPSHKRPLAVYVRQTTPFGRTAVQNMGTLRNVILFYVTHPQTLTPGQRRGDGHRTRKGEERGICTISGRERKDEQRGKRIREKIGDRRNGKEFGYG